MTFAFLALVKILFPKYHDANMFFLCFWESVFDKPYFSGLLTISIIFKDFDFGQTFVQKLLSNPQEKITLMNLIHMQQDKCINSYAIIKD